MPYREMLASLFDGTGVSPPSVPVVTRAYEEAYMREPIDSTERRCVMEDRCECTMISRGAGGVGGFVGVEFILPNEGREPTR